MKTTYRKILILSCGLLFTIFSFAQKKIAYVSGKVVDDNEKPLSGVSIIILGQSKGIVTNDSGFFRMSVVANKAFALIFTYTGRRGEQRR